MTRQRTPKCFEAYEQKQSHLYYGMVQHNIRLRNAIAVKFMQRSLSCRFFVKRIVIRPVKHGADAQEHFHTRAEQGEPGLSEGSA
eukprot:4961631-Pyramimonas_sp.AAC.1